MLAKKILLECVTVSVNYSDFLAETIAANLPQIDLWTIVTSTEDRATQALCAKYGLRCLKTDCFFRDADPPKLNKSRGINYGLAHHSGNGWMMHLDADIVLPPMFRKMVENAELDPTCIYGMDRVNCPSAKEWDAFRADPELQYEWSCLVKPPRGWKIGARIAHGDFGGYVPLGCTQIFNPTGSGINRYPIRVDGDMEHSDVLFGIQWERRKRHLLPEGFTIHLQSTEKFGANWKGRTSPPFRPVPTPPAPAPAAAPTFAVPSPHQDWRHPSPHHHAPPHGHDHHHHHGHPHHHGHHHHGHHGHDHHHGGHHYIP